MPDAEQVRIGNTTLDMAFPTRMSRPLVLRPPAGVPVRRPLADEQEASPGRQGRELETLLPSRVPRDLQDAQNTFLPAVVESQEGASDPRISEFVSAALATEETVIQKLVDRLLTAGVSVQSIYLDLLAPAARRLGEMWVEDSCDFVEVTMAVGRLQLALRHLSQMFVRDRPEQELAGRVLLACVPGEQHSLGLFMVAEFFVRDGWEVHVGPPLTDQELLADVSDEWYDVVGFSVACDSRLDHLKREIHRVRQASRNRNVLILAGGRALNEHPGLLERIGADGSAENAELAPECVRRMLDLR